MKHGNFKAAVNAIIATVATCALGDEYSSMEMALFASAIFSNLSLIDLMGGNK